MKKKTTPFPHYWLCWDCAETRGGTWPVGHCATVTMGTCPYCNKEDVTIIPYVDFNWKDDKELDNFSKRNRD